MNTQELLDALKIAQNETQLDQVAVWALSKYLQDVWKDEPDKTIRPFDLGKVLSLFYVDLSQHRLPDKITKQTPETESLLMNYFGATKGGLSKFWTQCTDILSVTLEPHPDFAREVKKYLEMLLKSSKQGNNLSAPAPSVSPSVPVAAKSPEGSGKANVPVSTEAEKGPESTEKIPASVSAKLPEGSQKADVPVSPNAEKAPDAPAKTPAAVAAEPHDRAEKAKPSVAPGAGTVSEASAELPAGVAAEPHEGAEKADAPVSSGSESVSDAPAKSPVPQDEPEPIMLPRNAYLVLQGTRVIPLNQSFIKLGRQLDNHIILEDPRVSRSHAQLKLVNDRFVIFDMNSTGGTFVNGQRTSQSVLFPGDVVSLAGVLFTYSQELPAKPGEVKILNLGSPVAADRPTAVMHRGEVKQALNKASGKGLPDLPKTGPLKKTGPLN